MQNDHKALTKEIEGLLHAIHGQGPTLPGSVDSKAHGTEEGGAQISKTPFTVVKAVSEQSPASECGLQVGDRIVRFGPLSSGELSSAILG